MHQIELNSGIQMFTKQKTPYIKQVKENKLTLFHHLQLECFLVAILPSPSNPYTTLTITIRTVRAQNKIREILIIIANIKLFKAKYKLHRYGVSIML